MIERLGDEDYYLVPENEKYPSMGAEVRHRDELSPEQRDPALSKAIRMDRSEADTLVRQISVSEVMGAWSYGSNNNVRVLAIQEATKEEFGLTEAMDWRMDPKDRKAVQLELLYNRDALKDFVRTQYEMTQELLQERGITEVIGYRAMTWPEGAPRPEWAGMEVGESFEARHRPLASWSADRQIVADWLETRGGPGVILVDRTPAGDVLSVPATGMGYFGQKEWVTLPGDRPSTLDGLSAGQSRDLSAEKTAASSINVGAPALGDDAAASPSNDSGPAGQPQEAGKDWHPLKITGELDPSNPSDKQVIDYLDGRGEPPEWWPKDDSGYSITKRDLDFLGISPVQLRWMGKNEAPMGMTPELYDRFGAEMMEALGRDGFDPRQVDIRLKGTGSGFFSGKHKTLPTEQEIANTPEASRRYQEWLGDSDRRPLRRPHDAMFKLGLEDVPSDFDIDINSSAMIRSARKKWQEKNPDRYSGDFMGGHGYLDKQAVHDAFPALTEWAQKWEGQLGREISLGAFESSGPVNTAKLGRSISGHHSDTDWIIHNPGQPHPSLAMKPVQRKTQRESSGAGHGGGRGSTATHLANLAKRPQGSPASRSPWGSTGRRPGQPNSGPDRNQGMDR